MDVNINAYLTSLSIRQNIIQAVPILGNANDWRLLFIPVYSEYGD